MRTAIVAAIFVIWTVGTVSAQQPSDTKGWHGAEWGMTKDQVAAVTGFKLGEAMPRHEKPGSTSDDPFVECRTGGSTAIGDVLTTSTFCFRGTLQPGLMLIMLRVQDAAAFRDLRTELKARYGEPTAEEFRPGSMAEFRQAKWLLPSTEIALNWIHVINTPDILSLSYSRRTAPIL